MTQQLQRGRIDFVGLMWREEEAFSLGGPSIEETMEIIFGAEEIKLALAEDDALSQEWQAKSVGRVPQVMWWRRRKSGVVRTLGWRNERVERIIFGVTYPDGYRTTASYKGGEAKRLRRIVLSPELIRERLSRYGLDVSDWDTADPDLAPTSLFVWSGSDGRRYEFHSRRSVNQKEYNEAEVKARYEELYPTPESVKKLKLRND